MAQNKNRYMSWRDLIITPLVQTAIFVISILFTWQLDKHYGLDLFTDVIIFYFTMVFCTILCLKIMRFLFPFKPGVYIYTSHIWHCYMFNLYAYLGVTNLFFFYHNILISPVIRKYFYMLLGAKMGKGIILIGGKIADPWLISIEKDAHIGEDAVVTPHVVTSFNVLILGKITIKKGALIGIKSVIMPGVTIGENSMVQPLSVVTMGTTISPNEVWGGNPAKKIKDLSPPINEVWEDKPINKIEDISSFPSEGVTHGKM